MAAEPKKAGHGVSPVAGSAAQDQYGDEEEAAGQVNSGVPKQDVFTPPVVLSAEQDESGSLPLTGAALLAPVLVGGAMLGAGLVLLYRTRRRED